MVDQRIVEYIKESLSKGFTSKEIENSLTDKGWPKQEIDSAMKKAEDHSSPKKHKGKESSSKFALFLIILGILIVGGVILLINLWTPNVSSSDLSQGTTVTLSESKGIKLVVDDEEHKITLESLGNTATLLIQSDPVRIELAINEEEKLDLNNDGNYDLIIRVTSIGNGKAEIFIQEIDQVVCTEEWECTNWGVCENGNQERECADTNECGTEESKPIETQNCEIETNLTCLGNGGEVCNSEQTCNGSLFGASDTNNCCLGSCEDTEPVNLRILSCGTDLDCLNCGEDIDCFINEVCNPASLDYNISVNLFGFIQNITYYSEIRGLEQNKCIFYTRIEDASGNYDEATRQAFLDNGATEEEINQQEQLVNEALQTTIGKDGTCKYLSSELVDDLQGIKEGTFAASTEDAETYECEGSLYQ